MDVKKQFPNDSSVERIAIEADRQSQMLVSTSNLIQRLLGRLGCACHCLTLM